MDASIMAMCPAKQHGLDEPCLLSQAEKSWQKRESRKEKLLSHRAATQQEDLWSSLRRSY